MKKAQKSVTKKRVRIMKGFRVRVLKPKERTHASVDMDQDE